MENAGILFEKRIFQTELIRRVVVVAGYPSYIREIYDRIAIDERGGSHGRLTFENGPAARDSPTTDSQTPIYIYIYMYSRHECSFSLEKDLFPSSAPHLADRERVNWLNVSCTRVSPYFIMKRRDGPLGNGFRSSFSRETCYFFLPFFSLLLN